MATLTIRGQNYHLALSRTSSGTKVQIASARISMRNINVQRTRDVRTAPGGGELGRFYQTVFTIECDANPAHDPLFRDGGGQRFWCEAKPEGSSDTAIPFQAVCGSLTLTASQTDDSSRYSAQLTVDGDFNPWG